MKINLKRNFKLKVVEILKEVENLNFRTALKKMHLINQNNITMKLSFTEKMVLLSYQFFCYEYFWDQDNKNLAYNKLCELCRSADFEQDPFIDLVYLTHMMRNTLKSKNNYDELIEQMKKMEREIPTLLEQIDYSENILIIKFIVFFYHVSLYKFYI